MLTREMIHEAIVETVDGFDVSTLADDADFGDSGIDSLDLASLLLELQEKQDFVVEDEEIALCLSVKAILTLAEQKGV